MRIVVGEGSCGIAAGAREVHTALEALGCEVGNVVANTYPDAKVLLKVEVSELLGAETLIHVTMNTQPLTAKVNARVDIRPRDEIELAFDMNKCHFFDPQTELRIVR